MSRIALTNVDLKPIKRRLADSGELPTHLYEIKFDTDFNISEGQGIQKGWVVEALKDSNEIEHLELINGVQISIFAEAQSDFILLGITRRSGYKLTVENAWHVFRSDIDLSTAKRPLDVLKLLVDKYGYDLTIGNKTSKFFLNDTVIDRTSSNITTLIKVNALDGVNVYGLVLVGEGSIK
jgi:hypothetical protein